MDKNHLVLYQTDTGEIQFKGDYEHQTLWASLQQISDLFGVQKAAVSKHIKNIYSVNELQPSATVSKMETVQKEGKREIKRSIEYFNLDMIISVGYRVNSQKATSFRQWSTQTLHAHIVEGYTINQSRIHKNYDAFMQAVDEIQKILPQNSEITTNQTLELIKAFRSTWDSLTKFDASQFPESGITQQHLIITVNQLTSAIDEFKHQLIAQGQATNLFAQEKNLKGLEGIVGNIFQTFDGQDLYPTVEEKASHLLYFLIKDHPFHDGNKRSAAFAFVWFLQRSGVLQPKAITPQAITALTILIAESDNDDKERLLGLMLLLLNSQKTSTEVSVE